MCTILYMTSTIYEFSNIWSIKVSPKLLASCRVTDHIRTTVRIAIGLETST